MVVMAAVIAAMTPIWMSHGISTSMIMPIVPPASVVVVVMATKIVVKIMPISPVIACLSGRCSHESDRADSRAEQRGDAPEHKYSKTVAPIAGSKLRIHH
jgi:hypothetical protein